MSKNKIGEQVFQFMVKGSRYLAFFVVVLLGAVIAYSISIRSVVAGPGQPFGGQITSIFYCGCSGNYEVFFIDLTFPTGVTPLPLLYEPGGTITYLNYNQTTPGAWILGTWTPGGVCLTGKWCFPHFIQPAGTMYMVGSS